VVCADNGPLGSILPVITNGASGVPDGRHRISLDMGIPDNPSQPATDHNHKNDQPPHAEAQ
jgi:hypothetical protein